MAGVPLGCRRRNPAATSDGAAKGAPNAWQAPSRHERGPGPRRSRRSTRRRGREARVDSKGRQRDRDGPRPCRPDPEPRARPRQDPTSARAAT